jgi:hypothetical protein
VVLKSAARTRAASSRRLAEHLADSEQESGRGAHEFITHPQHIPKVSTDVLPQPDHINLAV